MKKMTSKNENKVGQKDGRISIADTERKYSGYYSEKNCLSGIKTGAEDCRTGACKRI